MDPWSPGRGNFGDNSSSGQTFPRDDVTRQDAVPNNNTLDLHSDQYLWAIEAKLQRMKGSSREPRARDLIEGLQGIRQAQLQLSCSSATSDLPYISDSDYMEDFDRSKFIDQLQKKFAPESQAVNPVELQVLVEHDELEKHLTVADDTD